MKEEHTIEQTIRRAELTAQSDYDLGRLIFPHAGFLNCSYRGEREEVVFCYEIEGFRPLTEVKKERRETIIINLIGCACLAEAADDYKISLAPENLYYNLHNQVAVMARDVYGRGEAYKEEEFLRQYRSLIGYLLQNRYSYKDYYNGGQELLDKDKFLSKIKKAEDISEIVELLREEYERLIADFAKNKQIINRRQYRRNRILLRITGILLAAGIGFGAYEMLWVNPYQKAVIEAQHCYLKINYSGVIEAFDGMKTDRLSVYDKYILAYSYVQSENLTEEQTKNILGALSLDMNEKVLDYWICLGRLDVKEAQNIAQQISDNDLLLYAYLKEKDLTESDTSISGEEKTQILESLDSRIEQLSGAYEEDTEERTQEDEEPEAGTEDTESLQILDN